MTRVAVCSGLAIALASASTGGGADAQDADRAFPPTSATPSVAASTAQATGSLPAAGSWMLSETHSPIDYSPVVIATASASDVQLSIQCRGGRTDMVVASPGRGLRADEHRVSYAINDATAVPVALGPSSSGTGLALRGDVPRFLMALPQQGEIAFHITSRQGDALHGRFALPDLKKVLGRLAGPCKWPTN